MDKGRRAAQPICESDALVEGGVGVRFTVQHVGQLAPAFVVRYGGVVRAYLNRCAHRGTELDWQHGHFFDTQVRWLICATHGALYDPATGACVGGPCRSAALVMLPVTETDGQVCLVPKDEVDLVRSVIKF